MGVCWELSKAVGASPWVSFSLSVWFFSPCPFPPKPRRLLTSCQDGGSGWFSHFGMAKEQSGGLPAAAKGALNTGRKAPADPGGLGEVG